MTNVTRIVCAMLVTAGVLAVSAQTKPYYGTWRLNNAKSDMKGVTATYKDLGGNRVEISGMGQKEIYVVGRDGKDYPWVAGMTTTWRDLGPGRFENLTKDGGRVIVTGVSTLSADGNTIVNVTSSTPPGAKAPVETKVALARVSGGPGVFGTWRIAELGGGLQLEAQADGVVFRWLDFAESRCRFDGQDCPLQGPVPAGSTITLRELDPRSFEYQDKAKGKVNYTSRFTLSADGTTLMEEQTMPTGEKWHLVYDRER